jgi:hypothetical protein
MSTTQTRSSDWTMILPTLCDHILGIEDNYCYSCLGGRIITVSGGKPVENDGWLETFKYCPKCGEKLDD